MLPGNHGGQHFPSITHHVCTIISLHSSPPLLLHLFFGLPKSPSLPGIHPRPELEALGRLEPPTFEGAPKGPAADAAGPLLCVTAPSSHSDRTVPSDASACGAASRRTQRVFPRAQQSVTARPSARSLRSVCVSAGYRRPVLVYASADP